MNDLLHKIALTQVPLIGSVHAKILLEHFETAEEIFKAKKSSLELIEGIGSIKASNIKGFKNFTSIENEIAFIEKNNIQPLFFTDNNYPKRLRNCYDPPTMLYYCGTADLNASKIIAVIGTRSHSEYGRQLTEKLVNDLAAQNVVIASGMAFGIDGVAHKAALKNGLPTIGVLAHGLDIIYPPEHSGLAKEMTSNNGGLLTEFPSCTKPDKHNFPIRNRIVAGMSDATIVIETNIKGGSMITANLAYGYNRDVLAFPGRTTDNRSSGCIKLIKEKKASLITGADDVLEALGWKEATRTRKPQRELFIDFSPEEKIILDLLGAKDATHIDELNLKSNLSSGAIAAAILNLELQNVVSSLPGKMYMIN
ncbi:DNA-processing protein DprA [Pinibacter aurantiacus]|uniref:DNA-processing protein DprA n=1 Tax=Pinibacter aurantiacus TaxID=2851599 RepID=A0A9E2SB60_9BACT|nr:DNA-processing protein DprA [Pinibacter aurantiacus]MBV4358164.1 DNA-processing protein DprA [Pinibacter aurantiacus]